MINQTALKKQFLNRIKEHRTRETEPSGKQSFSDEFHDSINYLSSLSKKHKEENEKEVEIWEQDSKRTSLERKRSPFRPTRSSQIYKSVSGRRYSDLGPQPGRY
jgi:hypothetical protein